MKGTRKQMAMKFMENLVILCLVAWLGYMAGFNQATGGLKVAINGAATPPADMTYRTLAEVESTIAPVAKRQYGQGFNCLDFAWEAMRRLVWTGQPAMVVQLDLTPDPNHAVILVPTTDEGWVFLEPTTGQRIYPMVGGDYINMTTIEGIYIMGYNWLPIDKYIADIEDGVNAASLYYFYGDNG